LLHGVDVSKILSGIYEVSAQIAESSGEELLRFSRRFEIIQMDYVIGQPMLIAEQAEMAGRLLKYTASPEEYQFYQRLNLSGKAQFLIRFWRDRDPTTGTVQNEYLEQVQQRYRYANEHFSWGHEEGWASDRGRVLIQYGMPDEIDRHHSEAETVPYEIWIYSRERRYEFAFADLQSNGRFVLLHSSKEGEVHNQRWPQLIGRL
jgi:GWxTD domain-containing protein